MWVCFGFGNIPRLLLNALFILFQNSRCLIWDKSLQNENNRYFNAVTVQPYMCIRQSLLYFPTYVVNYSDIQVDYLQIPSLFTG